MGEAKRRGTFEERATLAKKQKEQQANSQPKQKPKVTKSSLMLASMMGGNI